MICPACGRRMVRHVEYSMGRTEVRYRCECGTEKSSYGGREYCDDDNCGVLSSNGFTSTFMGEIYGRTASE